MNLPTEPAAPSSAAVKTAAAHLFHASRRPVRVTAGWAWLRRLTELEAFTQPLHWAPDGDPSYALRVREL